EISKEGEIDRWRISFYQTNPETGIRERFRPTFELNRRRIVKSGKREELANSYIQKVNEQLPKGFPFLVDLDGHPTGQRIGKAKDKQNGLLHTPVVEALDVAQGIKCDTDRYETIKTYRSTVGLLKKFLVDQKLDGMRIGDFDHQLAQLYLDDSAKRKIGNVTYNNIIRNCRAVFTCLVDRGYLPENPFKKIKGRRKTSKKRTRFCPEDRNLVAAFIRENHPWFYMGVLLQYYCLVRPVEICRLQFKHFDLVNGIIRMPCEITKSWKEGFPTIPHSILHYFNARPFKECPGSWFLFSEDMEPGIAVSNESYRRKRMTLFHKNILDELDKAGRLKDREGLSWYSWSDTGIDDRRREGFNLFDLKELKRHESVTTTEMYFHHDVINKAVQKVPNVLEQ
ncbi:MAG: phage integrase SAM-like domain-containing protein, partial [Saprospiraceae bacterium]|nr:phage integrase SAM-like domain-containing protein [Saprospiraceae bacterium]